MILIQRQPASHWYLRDGRPFHEIAKRDGSGNRPVTLARCERSAGNLHEQLRDCREMPDYAPLHKDSAIERQRDGGVAALGRSLPTSRGWQTASRKRVDQLQPDGDHERKRVVTGVHEDVAT